MSRGREVALAVGAVCAAFLAFPHAARADETAETGATPRSQAGLVERAKRWFEEGQASYANGEFGVASHLFRAAYDATHAPEILYDLAQAERRDGKCDAALEHYRLYLQLEPSTAVSDIQDKIEQVRGCSSERPDPAEKRTVRPPEVTPPAAREGPARAGPGPTLRALGYGAAAGALVSAALGTVFVLRANAASDQLQALNRSGARWEDPYLSYESSLQRDNAAAIGFFVSAGVLAVASTTLFVLETHSKQAQIRVGTLAGATGVSWAMKF